MKNLAFLFISILSFTFLSAQKEIPCKDLKTLLDDALAKHNGDKDSLIGTNENTGISEYKYHMDISSWAKSVAIKEADFDGKIKSWGEVLVYQSTEKEEANKYADFVKAELLDCWKYGVDVTDKAGTEGREYSFVFKVHNQASWTDIELFVNHTGQAYNVYLIF